MDPGYRAAADEVVARLSNRQRSAMVQRLGRFGYALHDDLIIRDELHACVRVCRSFRRRRSRRCRRRRHRRRRRRRRRRCC
jgi:hypothetical protein